MNNTALRFQLVKRAAHLQRLCRRWENATGSIPSAGNVVWVPTETQHEFPRQHIVKDIILDMRRAAGRASPPQARHESYDDGFEVDPEASEDVESDEADWEDIEDSEGSEIDEDQVIAMGEDLEELETTDLHDLQHMDPS